MNQPDNTIKKLSNKKSMPTGGPTYAQPLKQTFAHIRTYLHLRIEIFSPTLHLLKSV